MEAKMKQQQEETTRQQQIAEQEKRDHDLAMRLAMDTTGEEVDPLKSSPKRVAVLQHQASVGSLGTSGKPKFDLSKWKYAELRDAINTSCDLELLEACREEFHRRLKVYHAWKSKNKKQGDGSLPGGEAIGQVSPGEQRAPQSILTGFDELEMMSSSKRSAGSSGGKAEQRYFRIPFARPADQNRDGPDKHKKGWWYAHFDGKWIARQMEIYEDKPAVLLLAGLDDMHMCELSLEETGLTTKQGAEILESEFESVWNKNGGRRYMSDHFGQISSKYVIQLLQKK